MVPIITDLITFLDSNVKSAVYTGVDSHRIYSYLEMIGAPIILTNLGQRSHNFIPSYSINGYAETLQPFIAALRTRQKIICEC